MSISFSGLGSGMDYSSWVDALVAIKQESVTSVQNKITAVETSQKTLKNLKSSFSTLNASISKFTDSNLISAFDIFSRKKATTSDENKTATASVSNSATVQNFDLSVSQLATPTVATGINNLGKLASMDTKLMSLNNKVIDEGKVSIYVNNEKFNFEVDENTTLQDFCDFLEEKTGGTVEISSQGTLSVNLEGTGVTDIKLGSTADDGNLLDFFGFRMNKNEEGDLVGFSSSKILTEINTTGKIVSDANLSGSVTEGTFTIGTVEFTIDSNTSISGIIYQINSNSDTGVTASYDAVANKLVLKAKEPGATTINIEAGTSNFTDVVGWTNPGGSLAEGSQELGKNYKFSINGKEFEAASNTITEEVTGITGLTLTLKKTTEEDEPVQINIENDLTEVEDAIEDFISKYNKLVDDLKTASGSDGDLAYDSSIRKMITDMANTIMNIVPGLNTFNSLSSAGISTGSSTTTNVSTVSVALVFDKTKFEKAMTENPDEVKKLFINKNSEDASYNGVMTKLESMVKGYLDIEEGYFVTKDNSFNSQISTLNESLTRKQNAVDAYRERLTKQFQNMDTYISNLQSAANYLSSISSSSS